MICKHCGTEFQGKFCPECGAKAEPEAAMLPETEIPERKPERKKKKPFYRRWWFWVIVIFLVLSRGCGGRKRNAPPKPTVAPETQVTTVVTEPVETTAEEETTIPETTTVPETTVPETTALSESTIRPDFKAAMDAYEEFYDEYCDLMAQYTKNPTDFSLLAKYGNMLSKMTEIDAAFEKWDDADMSTAEAAYYLEVNGRVLQKLAKIVG